MESAIPVSKISALSSGEFVGMVADDPKEKIKLKMLNAEILNDTDRLNKEMSKFKDIPMIADLSQDQVMDNYYQVKYNIGTLIEKEVATLIEEKEKREQGN